MKRYLILVLALAFTLGTYAQTQEAEKKQVKEEVKKEKKVGIKLSGFVKNDFFWDSRQTVSAREGHFMLWPKPVEMDPEGCDINGQASFNFLSLQSRVSLAISGPDALGAKTSGLIEGDFFAQAPDNIHLLRLRHAFIKMNWEHLELLAGQFWNPFFVTASFPGTVSFNSGTPMQSFARNPQIRATYKIGPLSLIAAALSQRDFQTIGIDGKKTDYLRNSAIPDMHFQVHFATDNEEGMNILAGAGMAYKTIVPRLTSADASGTEWRVHESLGGLTLMAFTKLTTGPVTIKLQGRYGENISDLLSISGFGVTEILDPLTGEQAYTPIQNMSFWGDVHTNGNPQVGIFAGYTQNLGAKEDILDASLVYGFGMNIQSLYRVSPRIIYNVGKVRLAAELEYTSAAYGEGWDLSYLPTTMTDAGNLRVLTAIYLFF